MNIATNFLLSFTVSYTDKNAMEEIEVKDSEGISWKCIEAFSGGSRAMVEKAAEVAENNAGKVTVVCTPSGGYQTVRIEADQSWKDTFSEDYLLKAIEAEKGKKQ